MMSLPPQHDEHYKLKDGVALCGRGREFAKKQHPSVQKVANSYSDPIKLGWTNLNRPKLKRLSDWMEIAIDKDR